MNEASRRADSSRHFDAVASTWVARYSRVPSFRARLEAVKTVGERLLAADGGQGRVLDCGSGPGVLGHALSAFARIVVCLDTSWAMVRVGDADQTEIDALLDDLGMAHSTDVVMRVAGSARALAGAAQLPFDLILAVGVLEYQSDVEGFVRDLVDLLRPGGSLVLTVPNHRSVVRRVERPVDALAARAGRALRIARLEHRSYSSNRPFGSSLPWRDALNTCGLICREVLPIPLGARGVRRAVRPNLLVVTQRP